MKRRSGDISKNGGDKNSVDTDAPPAQKGRTDSADGKKVESGKWTEMSEVLIYRSPNSKLLPKMAAFDMDGTLITTKSGKRFPTSADDWRLWSQTVPTKLRALVADSYCIVLLTNQAAIERTPGGGKAAFKGKIEAVVQALGVPAVVLIAVDPDGCSLYRKPCTGGLKLLAEIAVKENASDTGVDQFWDMKNSFYVGDAAGRVDGWKAGAKKDFACSDRLFALNAGLAFHSPDEFFLNCSPAKFRLPEFIPSAVDTKGPPTKSVILASSKELVVYVGPPACGKSSFSKKHFTASGRYDVFSRDDLGTWQACVAAAKKSLNAGRSVVIDNTNPDLESRSRYVEVAKDLKVPARCFLFEVAMEQARHHERFRRLAQRVKKPAANEKPHSHVPEMAFNIFKSKFKEPTLDEGFSEVVRVKFVAEFHDPELEKLYRSYLIDK